MLKQELLLAALASSRGSQFSPVQIQKLLFLIDRRVGRDIGGPFFNFEPYKFGPFDKGIYDTLDSLVAGKLVAEVSSKESKWKLYQPTASGQAKGEKLLLGLARQPKLEVCDLSQYVLKMSFHDLIAAIYREYPDMQARSIFRAHR
jgi:uncharacterized protein